MTKTQLIKHIEFVCKNLSKGVVKEELDAIEKRGLKIPLPKVSTLGFLNKDKTLHPLTLLIGRVQYYGLNDPRLRGEILNLASLGEALLLLKNTKGLKERLSDLTSRNPKLFHKTFFELRIAIFFLKLGLDLELINRKLNKTADIRLQESNAPIDVECKMRDQNLVNEGRWNQVIQEVRPLINNLDRYEVIVKTVKNPTLEDVGMIINEVRKIILAKKEGHIEIEGDGNNNIRIFVSALPALPSLINYYPSKDTELELAEFAIRKDKNGNIIRGGIKIFGFKSEETYSIGRLITGIKKSIKEARQQLSKDKPGIICVNAQALFAQLERFDKRREVSQLEKTIANEFINSSRISGIIFESEGKNYVQGYPIGYSYVFYENKSANKPLPHKLITILKTQSQS